MKLVEQLRENHQIRVFLDAAGETHIELLDNSDDGGFLDTSRFITEYATNGGYYIPLKCGSWTPGTAREVVQIVRRLPVPVKRIDETRDGEDDETHFYLIDPTLFPEDDEMLVNLLSRGFSESAGYPWYRIMEQAMASAGTPSLF